MQRYSESDEDKSERKSYEHRITVKRNVSPIKTTRTLARNKNRVHNPEEIALEQIKNTIENLIKTLTPAINKKNTLGDDYKKLNEVGTNPAKLTVRISQRIMGLAKIAPELRNIFLFLNNTTHPSLEQLNKNIRKPLLAILDNADKKRLYLSFGPRRYYATIEHILHVLTLYYPLNPDSALHINNKNRVLTSFGIQLEINELPEIIEKNINIYTGAAFSERDRAHLIAIAEQTKTIPSDARPLSLLVSVLLGEGASLFAASGLPVMALIPWPIPALYGIVFTILSLLTLDIRFIILGLLIPTAPFAAMGYAIGALINYSNGRPADVGFASVNTYNPIQAKIKTKIDEIDAEKAKLDLAVRSTSSHSASSTSEVTKRLRLRSQPRTSSSPVYDQTDSYYKHPHSASMITLPSIGRLQHGSSLPTLKYGATEDSLLAFNTSRVAKTTIKNSRTGAPGSGSPHSQTQRVSPDSQASSSGSGSSSISPPSSDHSSDKSSADGHYTDVVLTSSDGLTTPPGGTPNQPQRNVNASSTSKTTTPTNENVQEQHHIEQPDLTTSPRLGRNK